MGVNDIKIIEGNKSCGMDMCAVAMAQAMRLIVEKVWYNRINKGGEGECLGQYQLGLLATENTS